MIDVVDFGRDDGETGGSGSNAHYVRSADDEPFVLKHGYGGQAHRTLLTNDVVGSLVGARLGVPVPTIRAMRMTSEQVHATFGMVIPADVLLFASSRIEPVENASSEAIAGASPENVAGVIVLNALLANTDVKAEHVLAQRDGASWVLYPVDWGHAIFGPVDSFANPPDPAAPYNVWPELLRQASREHLLAAISRAQALTIDDFRQILEEVPVEWRVSADQTETVSVWLVERARHLAAVLQI